MLWTRLLNMDIITMHLSILTQLPTVHRKNNTHNNKAITGRNQKIEIVHAARDCIQRETGRKENEEGEGWNFVRKYIIMRDTFFLYFFLLCCFVVVWYVQEWRRQWEFLLLQCAWYRVAYFQKQKFLESKRKKGQLVFNVFYRINKYFFLNQRRKKKEERKKYKNTTVSSMIKKTGMQRDGVKETYSSPSLEDHLFVQ